MKFTLTQTTYEVRDAGEIAFGILVLAILLAAGAILLAAPVVAILSATAAIKGIGATHILTVAAIIWTIGMLFVIRHYRRATKTWIGERRGGDMLFLVECIISVASVCASVLLPSSNDLLHAIRVCLAAFLLLLVLSHVATYLLLRYVPKWKELLVWSGLCSAIVLEIAKSA